MRILVVGATGYIGSATARALREDGHAVTGLARSLEAAERLGAAGFAAERGDLRDPESLAAVVAGLDPDVVLTSASAGGGLGDADAFTADRDAVQAIAGAIEGRRKTLIFTSGSAVFGVFARGERAEPVFPETATLPLSRAAFAPPSSGAAERFVHEHLVAIAARVEAERAALTAPGVRGIVIRPGNVWGMGGSVDIPKFIDFTRARGAAPYWGSGGATQGYVHLDDLVDLYRLALARGASGGIYHAVSEEAGQKELGLAISRMLGFGGRGESVSLDEMAALGGVRGVRLSLNKRLSAERTREHLGWTPQRLGVLADVEFGSYAAG
ncbi:nucleoside-diphosphate-sugar epimerase [Roseiarcus fermentans]|uniref:Nucleoside-diphosphate-sugar epimerase n=1 Tax=Roseiarcus fermentans TaxID=1473586 RepID=A0A366FQT0_9HYPH|nr:NAD-dependent epimerase/dehydratase family protein [Roseiarcus fermentans]RBP16085.1 nucleoside-diphosphate-sugar epimerase [Roseiarcus fermentans]